MTTLNELGTKEEIVASDNFLVSSAENEDSKVSAEQLKNYIAPAATQTTAGVITTGAQAFAGKKTFEELKSEKNTMDFNSSYALGFDENGQAIAGEKNNEQKILSVAELGAAGEVLKINSAGKPEFMENIATAEVYYGTCTSESDAQIKAVSISSVQTLSAGVEVKILFTNGNTCGSCAGGNTNLIAAENAPKIKINTFGAYPVKVGGEYAGEGFVRAGDIHSFIFDGSAFVDITSDIIYQGSTSAGNYSKKRNGLIEQRGKKSVTTETKNVNVDFQIKFTETPFINTTVCSDYTYTGSTGGPNNNNVVSRIGSINTPNESGFNINIILPEDRIGYGSVIWIAKGY